MAFRKLSFRDPAGSVYGNGDKIYRVITGLHINTARSFLNSELFNILIAEGLIPKAEIVDDRSIPNDIFCRHNGEEILILRQEAILRPVYPHEWTPGMLNAAAQLTLRVAHTALAYNWTLKDATPWNILFSDGNPIFIDFASFVPLPPTLNWLPYGQFKNCFVLPLYAYLALGITPAQIFLLHREGFGFRDLYPHLNPFRFLRPFEFVNILLPYLLEKYWPTRSLLNYAPTTTKNEKLIVYVLEKAFSRLNASLKKVKPKAKPKSIWSDYNNKLHHYTSDDHASKVSFVADTISTIRPINVIDLGANTGEYSEICAKGGCNVLSVDSDVQSLTILFNRVFDAKTKITPCVCNIARPTPAVGWRNTEVPSFIDRFKAKFCLMLCLGLFHHLLVTERIPMADLISFLFEMGSTYIIVEFITSNDPKFKELSSVNSALYDSVTFAEFEKQVLAYFDIISSLSLKSGTRSLYLLKANRTPG